MPIAAVPLQPVSISENGVIRKDTEGRRQSRSEGHYREPGVHQPPSRFPSIVLIPLNTQSVFSPTIIEVRHPDRTRWTSLLGTHSASYVANPCYLDLLWEEEHERS